MRVNQLRKIVSDYQAAKKGLFETERDIATMFGEQFGFPSVEVYNPRNTQMIGFALKSYRSHRSLGTLDAEINAYYEMRASRVDFTPDTPEMEAAFKSRVGLN